MTNKENVYRQHFQYSEVSSRQYTSLVSLLCYRARHQADQQAYAFLVGGEQEEKLTYGELDRHVRALAALLQRSVAPGERALLLYPPGLAFIVGFFACLYAGVVAVPLYPPSSKRPSLRFQSVLRDAQASVILTNSTIYNKTASVLSASLSPATMQWITTDAVPMDLADQWQEPMITGETLAFLQYTSGSTAASKGVMVTHNNLLRNLAMIHHGFGVSPASQGVIWLPPYHDMGLIGGILQPLYGMFPVVLMAPTAFLQHPIRWLEAISRYRASISGGPGFAYELCVRKTTPEQRATLNLSSWEVAFNGAEPVRADIIEAFSELFAPCGFRREAFYPCYGLAEATLIVSGGLKTEPPVIQPVQQTALRQGKVLRTSADAPDNRLLVGCGQALLQQQIMIVDPESAVPCPPEQIGEIWVAGPAVAQGYWNNTQQTEQTFHAYIPEDASMTPFLRTGDLGFLLNNELFITGRQKDLLIIRGRNHYPQDIELTVERSHRTLRAGCGVAFSIESYNEEKLVVVQEIERHYSALDLAEVFKCIRQAVAEEHVVQVYAITLIKSGSILKTSSGKLQRNACREQFLSGELAVVASSRLDTSNEAPDETGKEADLQQEDLHKLDNGQRQMYFQSYIQQSVARVLRSDPTRLRQHDTLISSGIDSLTAVELNNRVESAFGVTIPLEMLLGETTLAQIATYLRVGVEQATHTSLAPVAALHKRVQYPLSYGQQALWFLHKLAPGNSEYIIARAMHIFSPVNGSDLKQALQVLIDRHTVLRTTFVERQGVPTQLVHEHVAANFSHVDATRWSETHLHDSLLKEAYRPFDLAEAPLLRAHLFECLDGRHILLFTVHHIITDLHSLLFLFQELSDIYQSITRRTSLSLPAIEFVYADFVAWQMTMLAGQRGQEHWQYWQHQLAGRLPVLALPTDRIRSSMPIGQRASRPFVVQADLTQRLRELARKEGVTLYTTLLTAFYTFLYRYTGQTNILVGSTMLGRSHGAFANVAGYFANSVALRADLSEHLSLKVFLQQVQHTVTAALEHQDYPFSLLVEKILPQRAASYHPIFQVAFILDRPSVLKEHALAPFVAGQEAAIIQSGELVLKPYPLESYGAGFDLTLVVYEEEHALFASLEYNADLFLADTIHAMAENLQMLLNSMVHDQERCISALPLLTEEAQQKLIAWATSSSTAGEERCIHQLFECQVASTPDAIAVVYEDQHLSYSELNRQANQLAHCLRRSGVGPEVPVGLYLERSPDLIIALLGSLKAGGAYVPLDPTYPEKWRTEVIADIGLQVFVSQQHLRTTLMRSGLDIICLDTWRTGNFQEQETNPVSGVTSSNSAYILYTSGSTGKPKGVIVEHGGLYNLAVEQIQTFGVQQESHIFQFASCNFDASISEIAMALLAGATLYLGSRDGIFFGDELAHSLQKSAITTITLPPSVIATLPVEPLPALQCLISAGEPCFSGIVTRWGNGRHFFNAYGPTEATVCATIAECSVSADLPPTIGKPIAGIQVYLLDTYLQLAPIGAVAEIYIAGVGIARGYLHQPELTASHFVPHPFAPVAGARLYRSGDLGRYRADGTIEFLGRSDHQVKVRGVRVELEGIAAALREHPAVKDAIVVAHEFVANETSLIAYVVVGQQYPHLVAELHAFLVERVPRYALPVAILCLNAFPLTLSGKVDRQALPLPAIGQAEASVPYAAVEGSVEETLTEMWRSLLTISQVGIDTSFFALGGHSLLVLQLLTRIQQVFNVQLSVRSVFENPTIAGLSRVIQAATTLETRKITRPALIPTTHEQDAPLSSAQQRLWFLDQLQPGYPYHIPAAIQIKGPLDRVALARSAAMVAQRHEILRTTFAHSVGKPVQSVAPLAVVPLPLCDLRQLSDEVQERIVKQLAIEEAQCPFDLTQLPLMRMLVLQLADDRHVLLITVHHIIWDGWSTGIYLREIAAFYAANLTQQPVSLPRLPIQYRDFSIWQQQWLQQEEFEEQMSYWQQQLAGLSPLPFPTDRPRPEEPTYAGATHHFTIPAALAMELKKLSTHEDVTLFILLLAAFQAFLYRYTGVDDIAVGSNVANRTHAEIADLIGFFVNTLVIRTDASGNPRFRDFLRRVRDRAIEAYAHQDIPFEKIVERLAPRRSRSISPLVQIVFLMQNVPLPAWELQGNALELLPIDAGIAKYDLVFSLEENGDELHGQINYSTDLFTTDTITLIAERYVTLLQSIVAKPDARINLLEMFTAHERGHHTMNQHEQQPPIQKDLRFARRKALNLYDLDLVSSSYLYEGKGPLVLQPKVGNVLISDWAQHNRAFLEQELLKHGALLFRGFALDTTAKFEAFAHAISEQPFKEYGDLPREQASAHIYTSTPYPADRPILFHNESSHQDSWPAKICFFCATAAQKGGATPIADCREIYALLDPAIVERFEQKKVMYVRTFIDELDVSWQQFFQTTDRSVVEAYCARIHVACEWTDKGYLRTKQVCPAVIQHPRTGAKVFFNQIQLFHPSLLEASVRNAVLSLFQEDELPRNVYYGDGSRIEDSIMQEILAVYERVAVRFTWREGDVILLDNMLMAHARDPYQGPRKILVSMAETITQ